MSTPSSANNGAAHDGPVLLFDGVCNLCNAAVDFIIRRDKAGVFRFASLQSEAAKTLLTGLDPAGGERLATSLSTSILVQDGAIHTKSTAALRIARQLGSGWPLLYIFIIVPRFIRDFVYDVVGRNRYRWFGQKDTCRLPSEQERARFLG